jgi:hypothetical protein
MGFLLQRDFDQGEISGLNGGSRLFRLHLFMILETSNQIQQAVIFEIANEYSGKYIGSFEFNKLFLQGKGFGSCLSVGQWCE